MPKKTSSKQQIHDLKASNEFLSKKATYHMALLSGLQEQLDTATQFNAALLLKLGGSARLTPDDYRASKGLQLQRVEEGESLVLSVQAPGSQSSH